MTPRWSVGSLFSGIGGLDLGLEMAGLGPVLWQVESDPYRRAVLARHWPRAHRGVEDVRDAGRERLCEVDVVCGGFPCQDVSGAGKGEGLDGARSGLWWQFHRVVSELRPRLVVVENVTSGGQDGPEAPEPREPREGLADADREGHGRARLLEASAEGGRIVAEGADERSAPEPCLGRGADGLPAGLDRGSWRWPAGRGEEQHAWEPPRGLRDVTDRASRLRALGDAVVPRCALVAGLAARAWVGDLSSEAARGS